MATQHQHQNGAHDPWDNVDIPASHAASSSTFPFAQWHNGQKAFQRLHPVLGSGGWAIPVEQLAGLADHLPWSVGELPHKDGTSTDAYLAPELSLAVLATRFAWVTRGQRGQVMLPEYVEGAKGKVQALCAVKGLALPVPLMVTLSGMAGKHFGQVLKAFRQQIIAPANGAANRQFPLYAFWMPVKAGPSVNVGSSGKQSPITPPTAGWDAEALKDAGKRREVLRSLFVGDEVIQFCASQWETAQEWAQAWQRQAARVEPDPETGQIGPDLNEYPGELPPLDDDQIPF